MKFRSIFYLLCCCFIHVNAQTTELLAIDERGKLIYYEVVPLAISTDSLKSKTLGYLKKHKELKFKSAIADTAFMASGKMVISKTLLVMSHPSGEIRYNFQVEIKEGKYRFWLSDFNFIPYARDRYGNFVASTSVGTPLEKDPGKLNAAQWKEYREQTASYAKNLANTFKSYMASKNDSVKPAPEKKVLVKSW